MPPLSSRDAAPAPPAPPAPREIESVRRSCPSCYKQHARDNLSGECGACYGRRGIHSGEPGAKELKANVPLRVFYGASCPTGPVDTIFQFPTLLQTSITSPRLLTDAPCVSIRRIGRAGIWSGSRKLSRRSSGRQRKQPRSSEHQSSQLSLCMDPTPADLTAWTGLGVLHSTAIAQL